MSGAEPAATRPTGAARIVAGLRRRAWRAFYRARYLAVQRRRLARVDRVTVAGITVNVEPGVFHPGLFLSSELLVEAVRQASILPDARILDIGTGTGIVALAAAERPSQVVAVDIDARAVDCARANVMLAGRADRVEVRAGDLFEPCGDERFDLVLFNPPYLGRAPGAGPLATAFVAPPDLGRRFALGLGDHLPEGGAALVVLSTNGEPDEFLGPLWELGLEISVAARRDRGSEVLTVWRAQLPMTRA